MDLDSADRTGGAILVEATAFFLVWGLYFLARWSRTRSPRWAFFGGLWLGMIPTIRYPEALFGPAAGLFMVLHLQRDCKVWKSLVTALIGALIPISYLMIRNQMAFGAFWKTAYSLTNEQMGFGWKYFVQHAVPYIRDIQAEGAGLFAALGLVGMAALCVHRDTRLQGILLLGLVLPITLLYMAYYFAPGGMVAATMRFLLPTFYVYTMAGVWLLKMMAESRPKGAYAAMLAVLLVTACWGIPQSVQSLSRLKRTNGVLAAISLVVTDHAEPGAIVIASPQIQQHLDFIGRWRLADESVFQGQTRMPMFPRFRDDPDAPRLLQLEQLEEKQKTMERYKDTRGAGLSGALLDDLDAWAQPERRVYWIGNLEDMKDLVPSSDSLHVVAKIELPRIDSGELGLGGPFPGQVGPPMPGGRLGRGEQFRAMLEGLMAGDGFERDGPFRGMLGGPMSGGRPGRGGLFGGPQRRIMQMLLGGEELVLAEWMRSSDKER